MNLCPHCGSQNKPTARFCKGCGGALQTAPVQGAGSGQKICPNGHVYEGMSCPHCPGVSARGPAPRTVQEDAPPRPAARPKPTPIRMPRQSPVSGRSSPRKEQSRTVVDEESTRRLVGWLVVLNSGEERNYRDFHLFDGKNIIGRKGTQADVSINDRRISGQHAILVHKDGKYRITDMGSGNGTQVNGEAVESEEINPGDRLKLGRTTLVFTAFQDLAE